MSKREKEISSEVKNILEQCIITNNVLYLPQTQLDRGTYSQVNEVLIGLGAKWDRKFKGHTFEYPIASELEKVIKTGKYTNWKKETNYFYTPGAVVFEMLREIMLPSDATVTILEPSAGTGHILDVVKEVFTNAKLICVEMNPNHCEKLREKGYAPIQSKFEDTDINDYDLVLMNPPFDYQYEHIQKAYQGLNKGGTLISVASKGLVESTRGRGKKFRDWAYSTVNLNGTCGWTDLPPNSFKETGTNVDTILIVIKKV